MDEKQRRRQRRTEAGKLRPGHHHPRDLASVDLSGTAAPKRPPASKRLGQNFLTDQNIISRIINALDPQPDETIVEIGPGRGALTAQLVEHAGRVVAVEFDRNLRDLLLENFSSRANFKLVQGDALVIDFCKEIRPDSRARLAANLPYNISTAILQRLIEQRHCLREMVLMLQREVVNRITASPGSTERGYISVFVQAYCEIEKLFDVGPGAFYPTPKVWSSVIRLRPRLTISVKNETLLWQLVSAGFAQRRKTILNNLRATSGGLQELIKQRGGASIVLCEADVAVQRRAETLTFDEWVRITNLLG